MEQEVERPIEPNENKGSAAGMCANRASFVRQTHRQETDRFLKSPRSAHEAASDSERLNRPPYLDRFDSAFTLSRTCSITSRT